MRFANGLWTGAAKKAARGLESLTGKHELILSISSRPNARGWPLEETRRIQGAQMDEKRTKHAGGTEAADRIDASKRKLLQSMRKGAYAAPFALAMMTTKASACSMSC